MLVHIPRHVHVSVEICFVAIAIDCMLEMRQAPWVCFCSSEEMMGKRSKILWRKAVLTGSAHDEELTILQAIEIEVVTCNWLCHLKAIDLWKCFVDGADVPFRIAHEEGAIHKSDVWCHCFFCPIHQAVFSVERAPPLLFL